ncbi:tetratricopeptide repeat protein, partial [Calothrix rhizosoleniae]|uniref:tetratricopeptide repeat protein n=1 Tax=Calothrix rhizosoleniae TaxID=888997 RepID=UPI001178780E
VALTLSNLAADYKLQGNYAKAETMLLRVLRIAEQKLGANHPKIIKFRKTIQFLRNNQKQKERA